MKTAEQSGSRVSWMFLLIFAVLAAGIVAAGFSYYRDFARQSRVDAEHQLIAIAELKVGELAQWRKERLGDAGVLFKNPCFTALVRRFFEQSADADAQRQLQAWLGKYQTVYSYEQIRLMDTQGISRMTIPAERPPPSSLVVQRSKDALQSGEVMFMDFYRSALDQRIHLAVLVPLLDEADGNRPLGVVALRINPGTYLYPFIRRWPVASETAETLLVRREGNDAVFLNELRFQTNTALNLRIPLTNTAVPAVRAVLGQKGVAEGRDYRGSPVLAALHAVPDSPWFLVARRDIAEVDAPLRGQLWQVVAMVGVLLFGAGAGVCLVWWQQRVRLYRELANTAQLVTASENRYRRLFEAARDGILILDAETGQVVDVNPYLIELLGVTREVFLGKRVWELGFFKDLVANEANFVELKAKQYIRYEDMAMEGHDGHRHEVEFVSNVYLVNGRKVIQCIIRDISERVRTAAALRASEEKFSTAFRTSPYAITITRAEDSKIVDVNDAFLSMSGFSREETLASSSIGLKLWADEGDRDCVLAELRAGRPVVGMEYPFRTKSGEFITGLFSAQVLRLGSEPFILSSINDITIRKQAEEQLRQQGETLQANNEELSRLNRLMTGRELRLIEMKQQVNDLAAQLGQPRPHALAFMDAAAAEVLRTTPKPGEPEADVRGQRSEVGIQKSEVRGRNSAVNETPKETAP